MRRPFPITSAVPRLLAVAALGALSLTACSAGSGAGTGGQSAGGGSAAASSTVGSTSAGSAPAGPATAVSSSSQAPTVDASSGGAPDAAGPAAGEDTIVPGAANEEWMQRARAALDDTDPTPAACLDTLLDQTMLDAVATYLPELESIGLGGLRQEAGCTFTGPGDPGTAPTVQVKRFYLANDTSKAMDEAGLLGSDMCAADRDRDANGISTDVRDVDVFRGAGGTIRATVRAAWSCSENGDIGSAFLVTAAPGEKEGVPDPDQLDEPDFAVAAASHLHDTEVAWAPTLDDLYETSFRDVLGQ